MVVGSDVKPAVGDSTTKVVKFEQITTPFERYQSKVLLVILPQR